MHRLAWVAFLGLGLLAACGAERRAPEPETPQAAPTTQSFPRFEDRDPHDWDGRAPWSYPVHGIDVSRWQGQIDWRAVRGSGISFVYAKATEGGDRIDPLFRDYRRDARRAGLAFGAYHFFYFCRPAVEQARWFIRNVPREGRELPHVLDMEWNHRSPTCRLRPDGATVRREAKRFLDMLEAHYGRRPIVYTTPDFYRESGIGKLRGTEFWLRSVAGHPSETYPPRAKWTIWQYTGTGIVPGVGTPVDINAFRGSPDAWRSWSN